MAESDDIPLAEPEESAPRSQVVAPQPRPAWIDAIFAVSLALAFGLSLVRTPTTAAVAALVFLLGSVAYAILRIRWTRRHPRPPAMAPRTADGVLYLGVLVGAFLLSGVNVASRPGQIAYAVVTGLLVGGTILFLLRREETRRLRQGPSRSAGSSGGSK